MTAVAAPRRGRQLTFAPPRPREDLDPEHLRRSGPVRQPDGGRLTLEQLLDGVWEGLRAAGVANCPVCERGRMTPSGCDGCGSRLT